MNESKAKARREALIASAATRIRVLRIDAETTGDDDFAYELVLMESYLRDQLVRSMHGKRPADSKWSTPVVDTHCTHP